jgi:V-type H+-transporting ATPase subunit C
VPLWIVGKEVCLSAMAVSKYILVSLPLQGSSSSSAWENLQHGISKIAFDIATYKFHIPDLRVGTLDSLLALSDDLTKANSVVEGVTHKVKRQIDELERVAIADSSALAVDGVPIDSYVTR